MANQSPELLQETGAVGPQLLGHELAWQLSLRLRHRRRLSSLARVQTLLPTSLWKLWKLGCGTAVAPTGASYGAMADFTTSGLRGE